MEEKPKLSQSQKNYRKMKAKTPEGEPVPAARLRFPIIPKTIEYLDVIKNKMTIKSYGKEIAGLTWRRVSEKLFEDGVPAGKYSYGMKFFDNPDIYRGFIKSVDVKVDSNRIDPHTNNLIKIQETIESLKESIKTGTNSLGIDYIIGSIEKSHQAEISIYKMQIEQLKDNITELKKEITDLDQQLDQAENLIAEFNSTNKNDKITDLVMGLLQQIKKQ